MRGTYRAVTQPLRRRDRRVAEREDDRRGSATTERTAMKALGRHIPMAVAAGALVLASAAAASSPKVPTFAAARDYAAGEGPSAIAAGDLNGDGAADLVVSDNADQQCPSAIAVLLN